MPAAKKRRREDGGEVVTTPHHKKPDLSTPLRLPRNAVGSTVEVFWAGDSCWYRATVVKCDHVNQCVCVRYEGEQYGEGIDGEWEPALAAVSAAQPANS
jgi:hypothetical protein